MTVSHLRDPFADDEDAIDPEGRLGLPEAFRIDSEERAEWLLRKLGNLAAEADRVSAQAKAIVDRINIERKALTDRFGAELQDFARAELARRNDGKKTLRFLQGTVGFRSVPAHLRIADSDAALDHAKEAGFGSCLFIGLNGPAYIAKARQAFDETGELLPGVDRVPDHESFRIDVGQKKGR